MFQWLVLLLILAAAAGNLLQARREGSFAGDARKQPFQLETGEVLLFRNNWVGGLLYPRAEDCNPRVRIRYVASQKKCVLGNRHLRLWLTDRRLMLQSRQWRNTWRIIPLSSVEWVGEAPRRHFFSPERVVIGYHYEGHSEALVLEDKSIIGKTLKEALLAVTSPSGEHTRPLSSDLPNEEM